MSQLLTRVSSLFVEPAPAGPRPAAVAPPEAPSVAVLCRPGDAPALGCAVAIRLARNTRSPLSVAGLWVPGDPRRVAPRAPAVRAASGLATSLRARDVATEATGRVVRASLPFHHEEAMATAERIYAATDAPVVLVIAGPRTHAIDAMLARQDALLVAAAPDVDDPEPIAQLAARRLAELGPPVQTLSPALPPFTRALALAGLAAPALGIDVDLGRAAA